MCNIARSLHNNKQTNCQFERMKEATIVHAALLASTEYSSLVREERKLRDQLSGIEKRNERITEEVDSI